MRRKPWIALLVPGVVRFFRCWRWSEAKIVELAANPKALSNQVKALKGAKALRLQVGDYRVIFTEDGVILTILRVGHRGGIYS